MSSDLGRAWTYASGCTVCGTRDERALTTTRLKNGDLVVVCGTHEIMHQRAGRIAVTVSELRGMVKERRLGRDRRNHGDELGGELEQAFSPHRRVADRRRN